MKGWLEVQFKINIPSEANEIIHTLQNRGHSAYVVGGCVRDSILDRPIHDWDICTSATPNEMLEIFKNKKIIETGLQHGTITVVINGEGFEVTTYRIDGTYSDNRRPDSVSFTNNLIADLSRRDFTINAMAYSDEDGLIDPFNGLEDLHNKVIRCVGNPRDRFNEDALRILRAIRFACQLGFNIHPSIGWQIGYTDITKNLQNVSIERINSEFTKMVVTEYFYKRLVWNSNIFLEFIPELADMRCFQQNNPWHIYDVFCHTVFALGCCKSDDLIVRLAVFFHDFGKPHCYQDGEDGLRHFRDHAKVSAKLADSIMKRLRFDNETREKVVQLVSYHDATIANGKQYIKKWLNKIGEEQFRRLLKVKIADNNAQNTDLSKDVIATLLKAEILLEEVLNENECFSLKQLAVNGKDLTAIGYKQGEKLGNTLNNLLTLVIAEEISNDKESLLGLAQEWI